jgi:heme exporter protein A
VRANLHEFHAELAYVGHEPPLKADLTARENLRYWVGMRRPLTVAQIDSALDVVEAANEWRERPVRTLSAGQRRRVALAGLSLLGVPLWLLDEPTTNLDTAGQNLVTRMLEDHVARGGLAVVAVHHELGVRAVNLQRMVLAP